MVDLHCHILPAIDDGAATLQESRALLESSLAQGVRDFVFTPHFYPERMTLPEFVKNRAQAAAQVQSLGLPIRFRLGAEVRCTPFLAEMDLAQLAFSGHLLLELDPDFEPYDLTGLLQRLRRRGVTPILAHVERYPYRTPEKHREWVRAGALCQVNAGWVSSGRRAEKQFRRWTRQNLAHVLASDCHNLRHRPPNLASCYAALPPDLAKSLQKTAETIFGP